MGRMQRTRFTAMDCPIARSLDRVGEWWSILILRDALGGMTRFEEFQKSLKIAPNMLTRRLNALVDAGFLARRRYSEHPPRHEYIVTERGRDFRPILIALIAFGNRHFAPEGASVTHRRRRFRRAGRADPGRSPDRPAARLLRVRTHRRPGGERGDESQNGQAGRKAVDEQRLN